MTGHTYNGEIEDTGDFAFHVEVELTCSQYGEAPSGTMGPPEFYDPGCGPEFDVDAVLVNGVKLDEKSFVAIFNQETWDRFIESAETQAAESGEFG